MKNKNIGNEELELLSHVAFQNVQEIDLSHNKISKIDSLGNFSSEKIKKIDLSHNDIDDIKTLKIDLKEKKVLVRCDFNVPRDEERNITDWKAVEQNYI